MVRRRSDKAAAGWHPRTAGLVLCAFFILGMMTGFSANGRALVLRVAALVSQIEKRFAKSTASAPARDAIALVLAGFDDLAARAGIVRPREQAPPTEPAPGNAIAMVERHDGFYALLTNGELRGPVSPNAEGDLPILSGSALENAHGGAMVEDAALLVRAEAELSEVVSEMNVGDDGTASLFLEGSRTEVMIDLGQASAEVARANEVLLKWRGRERMIAAIDMTTPGQAVVRLRGVDSALPRRAGTVRRTADPIAARRADRGGADGGESVMR